MLQRTEVDQNYIDRSDVAERLRLRSEAFLGISEEGLIWCEIEEHPSSVQRNFSNNLIVFILR